MGIDAFDLFIFIIVVIVFGWVVTSTVEPDQIEPINITYDVKEVHLGYANGYTFYEILYVSGDKIKSLSVTDADLCLYKTNGSAKFVWVSRNKHGALYTNKFELYIPDNMSFAGQSSEYHVGKHTEHAVIY